MGSLPVGREGPRPAPGWVRGATLRKKLPASCPRTPSALSQVLDMAEEFKRYIGDSTKSYLTDIQAHKMLEDKGRATTASVWTCPWCRLQWGEAAWGRSRRTRLALLTPTCVVLAPARSLFQALELRAQLREIDQDNDKKVCGTWGSTHRQSMLPCRSARPPACRVAHHLYICGSCSCGCRSACWNGSCTSTKNRSTSCILRWGASCFHLLVSIYLFVVAWLA